LFISEFVDPDQNERDYLESVSVVREIEAAHVFFMRERKIFGEV